MTYLFRVYKGTLLYINQVEVIKTGKKAYDYKIIEPIYKIHNHLFDKGDIGSAIKSAFTDEQGIIKVIFTEVYSV